MTYYIGAGTNLGDRIAHLLFAHGELKKQFTVSAIAPLQENPPLLPEGSPERWYKPYLNTVFAIESKLTPETLLKELKRIEQDCGRTATERWAPRVLDLDILCTRENTSLNSDRLNLPHAGVLDRAFTLNPLAHLQSHLQIGTTTALKALRQNQKTVPYLMAVLNCTPDSFSNSRNEDPPLIRFQNLLESRPAVIDLGAESTRSGAEPVSPLNEILRLKDVLEYWKDVKDHHPWTRISVDTRHAKTARFALDHGVSILNDVSHLSQPDMREIASQFEHVIFMHSLTVPADPKSTVKNSDVIQELKDWCTQKLEALTNIPSDKLIFDPGIGFNKTPLQSLRLLQGLKSFSDLPVRLLVGHSRKSFMNLWTEQKFPDRDSETVALSLALLDSPANILRVHEINQHQRALLSYQCVKDTP